MAGILNKPSGEVINKKSGYSLVEVPKDATLK